MSKKVGVSSTYARECQYINNRANLPYASIMTPTVKSMACQVNDTTVKVKTCQVNDSRESYKIK